ncbi:MAG: response regulator [Micavibrio sp.]|nr:MAG: response regulator [Micavibrio sp.]
MSYDFTSVKVLVVESSPPLFQLIKGVLTLFGVPENNVDSAFTVEEGFDKFAKTGHDMVIVDWMDTPDRGIQLVRRMRTDDKSPNPFVPILMTAGSGHSRRVLKSRDAGVSDYLVKPFSAQALARRIERMIEKPRPFVYDTKEDGTAGYVGPDRRVKQLPFEGEDRRKGVDPKTSGKAEANMEDQVDLVQKDATA